MGKIHSVNDLGIISFHGDQAGFHEPLLQKLLGQIGLECAENIARAEVNPLGGRPGMGQSGRNVEFRKQITGLLPGIPILQAASSQFHLEAPFLPSVSASEEWAFSDFSMASQRPFR